MLRLSGLESGWGCSRWVRLDLKIPKVVLESKIGGQGAKRRPSENDTNLTNLDRKKTLRPGGPQGLFSGQVHVQRVKSFRGQAATENGPNEFKRGE